MGETFWRRWSCFVQPRDISVLSSVLSSYGSFPLIYVLPQLIHSEILKYETTQLMYNIFILVFSLSLSLSLFVFLPRLCKVLSSILTSTISKHPRASCLTEVTTLSKNPVIRVSCIEETLFICTYS